MPSQERQHPREDRAREVFKRVSTGIYNGLLDYHETRRGTPERQQAFEGIQNQFRAGLVEAGGVTQKVKVKRGSQENVEDVTFVLKTPVFNVEGLEAVTKTIEEQNIVRAGRVVNNESRNELNAMNQMVDDLVMVRNGIVEGAWAAINHNEDVGTAFDLIMDQESDDTARARRIDGELLAQGYVMKGTGKFLVEKWKKREDLSPIFREGVSAEPQVVEGPQNPGPVNNTKRVENNPNQGLTADAIGKAVADALARGRVEGPSGDLTTVLSMLASSQEQSLLIQEAQEKLRRQISEDSLRELLVAYLNISAPRERMPQDWEHNVPKWAEGLSKDDWRDLLSMQDSLLGAVYQKRNGQEYSSVKGVKEIWGSMFDLKDKDLKKWCENREINLLKVMTFISRELLVPKTYIDVIDGKRKIRRIYVFESIDKGNGKHEYTNDRVKEFVADQTKYKEGLSERIAAKGIVRNEMMAKMAVAMAMDVMEIGGVFSLADTARLISWESEGFRFAQRPETKVEGKIIGDEIFGGPWGVWAKSVSRTDEEAMQRMKKLGVIPKLLAGSFWDHNRKSEDVSWGDQIYDGQMPNFRDAYSGIYFGWRKDSIAPACDVMLYMTQKAPLSFKSITEADNTVSAWMPDLRNAIVALRGNKVSLVNTNIICAMIGASTNLYPTPGHYLRIGVAGSANFATQYTNLGIQIIEGLMLSREEMNEIKKFYEIGFISANTRVAPEVNSYAANMSIGRTASKRK